MVNRSVFLSKADELSAINEFDSFHSVLDRILTFEALNEELSKYNEAEKVLSDSILFEFHLDLVMSGLKAITEYNQGLARGVSTILEKAKETADRNAVTFINEAVSRLEVWKKSRLFEQEEATEEESSLYSLVKKIGSSLTEGFEPIGILHLVLDIIGLIPGIGVGADLINATIYFFRGAQKDAPVGMYFLGVISLVSAIPGFGDPFVGLKPAARAAEPVFRATMSGGAREGAEQLLRVKPSQRSAVVRLLRVIAEKGSAILAKVIELLGKLSSEIIAKASSLIPFIGGKLKTLFEKIGAALSAQANKLSNFSKRFKDLEKEAFKSQTKAANAAMDTMRKEGGSMKINGDRVTMLNKNGESIGEFSKAALFNSRTWSKKYPGLFSAGNETAEIMAFNNLISRSGRSLSKGINIALGRVFSTKTYIFLGKLIVKFYLNDGKWPHTDNDTSQVSDSEAIFQAKAGFYEWQKQQIAKQKKESGAIHLPAAMIDSADKEAFDKVTEYQNLQAKKFGQPSIIPVIYSKYKNEETLREFSQFYEEVESGELKLREDGTYPPVEEKVAESYLISFEKFNKSRKNG